MNCTRVWGFLKRKLGLSEEPVRESSNVNNCTQEPPPSSTSLNYNPDPIALSPCLKPLKRCRMDGGPVVTSLPSESVEPFAALCQLLTCSVCLDISHQANQCANGHLICLACSAQLEQSAFTAGRACSCPVCRVSLSCGWENGTLNSGDDDSASPQGSGTPPGLQRCLLAERLAAELPTACKFCNLQFPRRAIDKHRRFLCEHRPIACPHSWLGCRWRGGASILSAHFKSGCRLMKEEEKPWMRLAAQRMQSVGERTSARLQPWRGLLRLLQNRQHVHFGVRGLAGLRVILLPVVMTRLRRPGRSSENSCAESESNIYSSSVLCLPTGGRSSIWVQFELSSKPPYKNVTEDQPDCEAAVETTYRVKFRQCAKRPNMRRPVDRERIFTNNLIFYTLASFKSEAAQELEVFDCWHGLNEPDRSGSVEGESSTGGHTVTLRLTDADALPLFPENPNTAELNTSLPCIEPVNTNVIFGRDTLNCSFLFAIDPQMFTQERVANRSGAAAAAPRTPNNSSQQVVQPHVELVLRTGAGDDDGEEEEDDADDEDDDEEEDEEEEDDEEDEEAEGQEDPARHLRSDSSEHGQETETEASVNSTAHEIDNPSTVSLSERIVALRASTRRRRPRESI